MTVGYIQEVLDLQEQLAPFIKLERSTLPFPRWISTPHGDEGREWCSDCGYYKLRNLRHRDRKRREDYRLDGGWRTEENKFCFCAGCGVRLDTSLTDYGVDDEIWHYEECGFSLNPAEDAYEINEMLGTVEYRYKDDEKTEQRRADVVSLARRFLEQADPARHPNKRVFSCA